MKDLTIGIVFMAGIASYLSPCFLPLIPIYIGYLTGGAVGEGKNRRTIPNSLGFILGFTIIFVLLGATASGIGRFLLIYKNILNIVLGSVIIIMGIFYTGIINPSFMNREKRINYSGKKTSFFGATIFGGALALGWTPCIGPILASVLALAASKSSVTYGMFMLFVYSMGIAVPFFITALIIQGASKKIRAIMKYSSVIKIVSGVIMIITGVLLATGYLQRITGSLFMS